jgi:hypothetical protein
VGLKSREKWLSPVCPQPVVVARSRRDAEVVTAASSGDANDGGSRWSLWTCSRRAWHARLTSWRSGKRLLQLWRGEVRRTGWCGGGSVAQLVVLGSEGSIGWQGSTEARWSAATTATDGAAAMACEEEGSIVVATPWRRNRGRRLGFYSAAP